MAEQFLHEISIFFQKLHLIFFYIFNVMAVPDRITFISAFFALLAMFNGVITFPVLYNYFLIPRIEKKFGKKIDCYTSFTKYIGFGRFMCPAGFVAKDVLRLYFKKIFQGYDGILKKGVLKDIGYTINSATKLDIIMSFLLYFNNFVCYACVAIFYLVKKMS